MWLHVIEIPQLIILGTYVVFIWREFFGVKLILLEKKNILS